MARVERVGVAPGGAVSAFSWTPLLLSLLVQTVVSFPNQAFSPLAPFWQASLGLSREQFGLIATALYAGSIVAMLPAGDFADRFGVRPMFGAGMLLAGLGVGLMAATPHYLVVLAGAALCGVGNGVALPPTTRAIMNWYPPQTRAFAMSVKQTGVALAGAAMAWSVPVIAVGLGAAGALGLVGAAVLLAGATAWTGYRDPSSAAPTAPAGKRPGMAAVLANPALLALGAVGALYGLVQLSVVNFLVLFLTETLGYPVVLAGLLLGWAQLVGAGARISWGAVSDRFFGSGRRLELGLIGTLTALSMVALSALSADAPFWLVALIVLTIGLSATGWNGVHMTYVAEIAGKELSGTAAAMSLTLTYLGILVGPPVFGRLVDATGSYPVAFRVLAGVAALAVVVLGATRGGRKAGA